MPAAARSQKPFSYIQKTASDYFSRSHLKPLATDIQVDVAKDNYGCTIGEMPVQEFLDRFLPGGSSSPQVPKTFFHAIPTEGVEELKYQPFADVMNQSGLFPTLEFVRSDRSKDPDDAYNTSPDTAVYPIGVDRVSKTDWSCMATFVEFKAHKNSDGYSGKTPKSQVLDINTTKAEETRGQMHHYAAQLMDQQHRLSVTAVAIYGEYARLFSFDTSCIVVSEPIYYRKKPQPLADFFLRYCALSSTQQGYDSTVVPATRMEEKLFHNRVKEYLQRVKRGNLRIHPDVEHLTGPIWKIQVNDTNGNPRWFLGCKPCSIPPNLSPCGRLTRGYIVTFAPSDLSGTKSRDDGDEETKGKLYWLKDCWRPASSESEAMIYRHLRATGVPNLPKVIHAGDVKAAECVQETVNHTLLSDPRAKSWRRPTDHIRHMIHFRLVSELLIPLESVESAEDLLLVGRDILHTLAVAYHEANVYHRDLSKSNIMMTEVRSDSEGPWGVLNDWDRAKRIGTEPDDYHNRTASWQFVSVLLLADPTKPHHILDDLESLLWVLLYIAVRRFGWKGTFNHQVFDEITEDTHELVGRARIGGDTKTGWLFKPRINFTCAPLQMFFTSYRQFHKGHHDQIGSTHNVLAETPALREYREEVEQDVHKVLSYFNDILDDQELDWSDENPLKPQPKRLRAKLEGRQIARYHGKTIAKAARSRRATKSESEVKSARRVSDTYHVSTKTSETPQTPARRVPRRRVVVAATGHTYNLRPRKRR